MIEAIKDAPNWICECGKVCNPMGEDGEDWRWAGDHWQHHHGYPIGHIRVWRATTLHCRDCGAIVIGSIEAPPPCPICKNRNYIVGAIVGNKR